MAATEPPRDQALHFLSNTLAYAGEGLDALTRGNTECDHATTWPMWRIYWYAVASMVLVACVQVAGAVGRITSGWRCGPANARRGGSLRSRHLAGDTDPRAGAPGKPYAAIDYQWDNPAPFERLRGWVHANGGASALGDVLRRWTRVDVGVGIIFYRGNRIHVDVRANDWMDDQT